MRFPAVVFALICIAVSPAAAFSIGVEVSGHVFVVARTEIPLGQACLKPGVGIAMCGDAGLSPTLSLAYSLENTGIGLSADAIAIVHVPSGKALPLAGVSVSWHAETPAGIIGAGARAMFPLQLNLPFTVAINRFVPIPFLFVELGQGKAE